MSDLFASYDRLVKVLLPLPLDGAYDYRVPEAMDLQIGDYVEVPLGNRQVTGVVWSESAGSDLDPSRIKTITRRYFCPPLPKNNRDFVNWVAAYVMSPPGLILKMAMSVPDALEPPKPKLALRRSEKPLDHSFKMTKARRSVLTFMDETMPAMTASDIANEAGVSASVVKSLADLGFFETVTLQMTAYAQKPVWNFAPPALSEDQQRAANDMVGLVESEKYAVRLLDGVTGSGKTEVYFEAIAACMKKGKQALILLPEIALSAQWLKRFEARFGVQPALWHSDVARASKRQTWRALAEGDVSILVGARSALHLPMKNLGLIIVDEEHDQAFKQEEGIIYHARDMAIVRGSLAKCPVVLASATPSLETVVNVEQGRYKRLHLKERHGGATLPDITILDLKKAENDPGRGRWLSPPLIEGIKERLAKGEQALLFLNRRGYAPLTVCRSCGYRINCPRCSAWLVEHRFTSKLECHHCGYVAKTPTHCPDCGKEDSFVACGPGVERVGEEVMQLIPEARAEIVTSDSFAGPDAAQAFVDRMTSGEINLVIGTQIVAKGYHFPDLTLVGVVDADLGLNGGDLRASERTYQLMHQVAGRAGRDGRKGEVVLQTRNPEAPVIDALARGDRDGFMATESEMRKLDEYPPFGRLAAFVLSGYDADILDDFCRHLARIAPMHSDITILGPSDAPLKLLRGRHRRRFLMRAGRDFSLQKYITAWLKDVKIPNQIRLNIDIDPYSFM